MATFPDYSGAFNQKENPFGGYSISDFYGKDAPKMGFTDSLSKESSPSFKDKFGEGMRMAGRALEKWGKNKDNDFGYYGNRSGSGGMSGGGVQSSGDFTVIYPQQQQPYTIPGSKGAFGGALGTLAGIGASFIPGLGPGIRAALPSIGGSVGGLIG